MLQFYLSIKFFQIQLTSFERKKIGFFVVLKLHTSFYFTFKYYITCLNPNFFKKGFNLKAIPSKLLELTTFFRLIYIETR